MDTTEQITQFHDFLEQRYKEGLFTAITKGESFLSVDFAILAEFNPELADIVLEQPEDSLRAAELALERFDVGEDKQDVMKGFTIRIFNLPSSQNIRVRDIRSKHIGFLLQLDGIVRQKSDVRPQVTTARFECPSCGNIINVIQMDSKFKEPNRCHGCGRTGKFRLISKDLVDAQKIVLEEAPEELDGGEQPKRLNIFLKNDLVSPISERRTNPGSRIKVVGSIKEIPITDSSGAKLTRYDLILEANHVSAVVEDFSWAEISPEDKERIVELSKDTKIYRKLTDSIAPSIYGHEKVKEALVLQLLGGVKKHREAGNISRGDIHVLLVGDPGSGKSQLIKRISLVAPKARMVSGKGASGAGLTASVVRDEFIRGFALEAGALVLTNNGICCIDELDKMSKEDTSAMHEALEQQTVTISKANIQATLRAETTVLAAANPKFGRFDPFEMIAKQIDLPSTLINRFDLIFPIRDMPDRHKDEQLASFVLQLHKGNLREAEIPTELYKKYISYARIFIKPELSDEAVNEIKEYYVKMRTSGDSESGISAIPISARQLEALVRLSEASARTRLSSTVTKMDARRAIELMHFCLSQIGIDPETGKIDIDRISTGITASQRGHMHLVKEIISELESVVGKTIPIEDILREAKNRDIAPEKAEEVIEKLRRSGDLYSPKPGFVSRV